jgi:O-antigen/teichoic acid export membrane protein
MFKFPSLGAALKRVVRNFAANILGQLANGFYQIISIPLFLHYWTKQGYGEWLVLFSIPSLLWSLEGGLSGVANNRMTVASAKGDWNLVNALFQNVLLAQGILSVVVIGVTALLVSFVNFQNFFHFSHISEADTSFIILVLLCYMFTGFFISLFRAAYRTAEIEARGVMANNVWKFSDFCVGVAVLVCGGQARTLAEGLLIGAVIWTVILYFDVRRKCPRIEFGVHLASWKLARSIAIDGLPLLAGQAAMAFFLQGYPLVINRVLGASAVVTFVSIRTVSRSILLLNQVICLSSSPEVSRSYGRQDWTTYLRLLKIMLASATFAGVATLVGLTLFGPWAISLWTSGKVTMDHLTIALFAISIALQGICGVGSIVLVCSNMHHLYNYLYLAIILASLTVANLVIPIFGFIAVPGTMVLQDLILTILVFSLCRSKLSHISLGELRAVFTSDFYWGKVQALFNRADY